MILVKVFDEIPVREVVSWNTMVKGYAACGRREGYSCSVILVEAAQPLSSLGMAFPDLYIGKAAMSLSDSFGYPSFHFGRDCIDTNGVLGRCVVDNYTQSLLFLSHFMGDVHQRALVVAGSDDIANTYFDTPFRRRDYDVNSYTDLMSNSASSFIQ
ncbi:hypothetical protein Droror1_Dr00027405, partial [Drosera rotundifolia]